TARSATGRSVMSLPLNETAPMSGKSSPAMMRSSVVLPDPDGPSSARNSPGRASRLTLSSATKSPKRLVMPESVMLISMSRVGAVIAVAPFQRAFQHEGDQRQQGEERGDGERG